MSKYFPQQKSLGGMVKAEFDLSNYATKADLKNATGVDSSKFSIKVDLASLKSNVKIKYIEDKIPDITNLATNTTLNGKRNEVKNEIPRINTLDKFNKLTLEKFTARLAQSSLASKSDIANFRKRIDLNRNELKELSKKLQQY